MIRVLVAETSARVRENVLRRLEQESDIHIAGTAADGETAVQEALRLQPDIVVVDADLPGINGAQTTEMLALHLPRASVILISIEGENDAYRHAMLAGAREFLQKPFKGDELVSAIRRVYASEQRRRDPLATAPSTEAPQPTAKVIAVFSGKGGVGKSLIATNLAVSLAQSSERRVVLCDLSLQFGDIGALLNLTHSQTIAELAANDAVTDKEMVHQALLTGPANIKVLLAPMSPELADYVTTAHLRALMSELQRSFDFIVADTPSYLNEITLETIEMADYVVLTTDFNVPSVKNVRVALALLGVLKVDSSRVLLVGNHTGGTTEMSRAQVEEFLKMPLSAELPYSPSVVSESVNHAVPFMLVQPRPPLGAVIEALARRIDPQSSSSEPEKSSSPKERKKKSRRLLSFGRK